MTNVSNQVSQLAGPPARRLGDLIADSVAPRYWQPNSIIKACSVCKVEFPDGAELSDSSTEVCSQLMNHLSSGTGGDKKPGSNNSDAKSHLKSFVDDVSKHHCRACGRGVCARCSTASIPVPDHGYGSVLVRVCDQ